MSCRKDMRSVASAKRAHEDNSYPGKVQVKGPLGHVERKEV
jgi:hypothetical protein